MLFEISFHGVNKTLEIIVFKKQNLFIESTIINVIDCILLKFYGSNWHDIKILRPDAE